MLYDVEYDAEEVTDLSAEHPAEAAALLARASRLRQLGARPSSTYEALKALGYLSE